MDQPVREHLPSRLESLPTELLEAILSASRSKTDLHALISASPVLLRVFLSAKKAIFVSILTRDLGPALRDAVALTTLAPAKENYYRDDEKAKRIIQQYRALPRGGEGLIPATVDEAVALLRVNHSVQFLVDEFATSRLPELEKIHPDAARPLTFTERWRFAQALLRHQMLTTVIQGRDDTPPRASTILPDFFGLFQTWEMHQLADVHSFVCEAVHEAFFYCWDTYRKPRMMDSPPTELEKERAAAYCDFSALHRKLVSERARLAADPGIATAPWQPRQRTRSYGADTKNIAARFNCLVAGPLPVVQGSHRVAEEHRGVRDELYRREDAMPPLVHDEHDCSGPPFGWIDAHAGIDCQRWGKHARREVLSSGQEEFKIRQRGWMTQRLDQWRWLGLAFWDRGRVEFLKARMLVWETGWLTVAPPPEEECEIYRAPEEPRTRRTRRRPRASAPEPPSQGLAERRLV